MESNLFGCWLLVGPSGSGTSSQLYSTVVLRSRNHEFDGLAAKKA